MARIVFFVLSMAVAVLTALLSHNYKQAQISDEPIAGRNNTVLFLTTEAKGLSNVHIAAASALLESQPQVEIHYASFPKLKKTLKRVSEAARARSPSAKAVAWHELPGPDFGEAVKRTIPDWDVAITPPGLAGMRKMLDGLISCVLPWEHEEHWALYCRFSEIIDEVDPALIILDGVFTPAGDLVGNTNRRFVTITPNTLAELYAMDQPWGAGLWKYPALASGFPFPMPWKHVPSNIWLVLRQIWHLVWSARIARTRRFMTDQGVANSLQVGFIVPGVRTLLATLPEANLPVDWIPEDTKFFGPVVVDAGPAAKQDPEVARWLSRAPTILINLGSLAQYSEERASVMIAVIAAILHSTNSQVLWKFQAAGTYSRDVFEPVRQYIDSKRLRVKEWLEIDPISMLQTGDVVLFVHHGGAGSYHEAIWAGVPQVILPLWFDLYSIAQTAEYLGVGIWPGKETAPQWESDVVAEGILQALIGPKSDIMRRTAANLSDTAHSYGGRYAIAQELARLAALGK
ncbi:hypothetical protein B0I35DRAFT_455445 [Stachybotrys elegans]|uniref:Erythromycin biosynthesis protein CIII-like C-terminal domain-containing protein n=1 Tax=Stachybotrys elegans TaxID=80388 RepID=A0A8K0SFG6_9HYPO|nr:hypothetical protein B0I35DRAFT_455445 [Stachybotrys elegans]